MLLSGSPVIPKSDYLLCDGKLYDRVTYPRLSSQLLTTYGGSSSQFAVPNLIGATPLGIGMGEGLTPREIGQVGGAATVTLSSSELPSHSHIVHALSVPRVAGDVAIPANKYAKLQF